ncbi:hypothetical protein ABKW28_22395 [Nocardioides sp. 31GB23]|uniref:hypothetical protein n=1 Tax=Nocardioides sp. 31GB23 TaxID=3156065 RepID=UPI0032AFA8AD
MHTDPGATSPTPVEQIATAYDTDTDTAAALLAIAEKDPSIHNPAGYLLAGTEWTSCQRMLQQARERVADAATRQDRASRRAAAERELGPRPEGRHLQHLIYAWDCAAHAYSARERYPNRWRDELDRYRDLQRDHREAATA